MSYFPFRPLSIRTKQILLCLLTVVGAVAVSLLKPIAQDPGYHRFTDHRPFLAIPNFLNVCTNLPFVIVGVIGFSSLDRSKAPCSLKAIYTVFFFGILLAGFGSACYHYSPDNKSLVYDRIPMTLVFMSLLAAVIAEQIDLKFGSLLLAPLLLLGLASIGWWQYTEVSGLGDLRFYGFIQFYPVMFIPLILFLFPSPGSDQTSRPLIGAVILYVIAKFLEHFDSAIYVYTGMISGHSLKHLAAAGSTWFLVKRFQLKYGVRSIRDY